MVRANRCRRARIQAAQAVYVNAVVLLEFLDVEIEFPYVRRDRDLEPLACCSLSRRPRRHGDRDFVLRVLIAEWAPQCPTLRRVTAVEGLHRLHGAPKDHARSTPGLDVALGDVVGPPHEVRVLLKWVTGLDLLDAHTAALRFHCKRAVLDFERCYKPHLGGSVENGLRVIAPVREVITPPTPAVDGKRGMRPPPQPP